MPRLKLELKEDPATQMSNLEVIEGRPVAGEVLERWTTECRKQLSQLKRCSQTGEAFTFRYSPPGVTSSFTVEAQSGVDPRIPTYRLRSLDDSTDRWDERSADSLFAKAGAASEFGETTGRGAARRNAASGSNDWRHGFLGEMWKFAEAMPSTCQGKSALEQVMRELEDVSRHWPQELPLLLVQGFVLQAAEQSRDLSRLSIYIGAASVLSQALETLAQSSKNELRDREERERDLNENLARRFWSKLKQVYEELGHE